MMRLTIRTKFFLGMVAVSLIFISISIFVMNRFMGRIADNEVTSSLRSGKRAYERFAALRYDLMTSQARSIAQTPHLRAAMTTGDPRTVFDTAQGLYAVSAMNLMLLADDQGKLLADVDDPTLFGHDLRTFASVETGLEGTGYQGIWQYRDNLYRIVLAPIVLGDQILGLLILGELLDSATTEIREFTGREVLILHSGKVISQSGRNPDASLITQDEIASLVNFLEQIETSNRSPRSDREHDGFARSASPFRVILGGKACLVLAVPFGNVELRSDRGKLREIPRSGTQGYTVLFRALDEVESGVNALRIAVLSAGGVSMILAVILSLWLSERVSRPILNLRDAAEQFGAGRLEKRVTVHSKDEVGHLAQSFNMMVENLESAYNELENGDFSKRSNMGVEIT